MILLAVLWECSIAACGASWRVTCPPLDVVDAETWLDFWAVAASLTEGDGWARDEHALTWCPEHADFAGVR